MSRYPTLDPPNSRERALDGSRQSIAAHTPRGTRLIMTAEAKARAAALRAENDNAAPSCDLYGLTLAGLPSALRLAFAEPLLSPQPEPPGPPGWSAEPAALQV